MLIRSQDKKLLIDAVHLSISDAFGNKKCYIFARFAGQTEQSNQNTVAVYTSLEEAIAQLDAVSQFALDYPGATYQMR